MLPQNRNQHVTLVERFPLLQKILMRVGFYGFMIIGAYGIYLESILWGLIYSGFVIFGIVKCAKNNKWVRVVNFTYLNKFICYNKLRF